LLKKVVDQYDTLLARAGSQEHVLCLDKVDFQFSDSETAVRLDIHVGGYDVFIIQALLNPRHETSIDENYMAFLLAARAFRDHGARHVTAVLPYLAYARQDKPTRFKREPVTARLLADLSIAAGIDRLVTWHAHSDQLRGFYGGIPTEMLDSLTLFLDEFSDLKGRDDVIAVAPDAGASKFITYFGRALNLNCAIASKYRPQAEEAVITEVIGDFSGKRIAVVIDDMISSGGTIYELIKRLVENKGIHQVYPGASPNLCTPTAYERLTELHRDYGLKKLIVTNSITHTEPYHKLPFKSDKSQSDILSRTNKRINNNRT
jgi:ribose-phosphate pyrophosphokinase